MVGSSSHSTATYLETADIETSSESYARRFAGEVGEWFLDVQSSITSRMLAQYTQTSILDVGGGHGQIAPVLAKNGHRVTVVGSDPSCQARLQPLIDAGLCSFRVTNILELPYPDKAFDVVISYRLVSHVKQWRSLLVELTRIARNAVIIDYPTVRSVNFLAPYLFFLKKRVEGNTRQFRCFRDKEISEVFNSNGFVLDERAPEFLLPMALHRALNHPRFSAALERISSDLGLTDQLGSPVIVKAMRKER